jgi:hypothetical protein
MVISVGHATALWKVLALSPGLKCCGPHGNSLGPVSPGHPGGRRVAITRCWLGAILELKGIASG